jgi:ferritin-like metal-binding protein YciE
MSDPNERDAKLVQYMNEAYGKERELETALQAHIAMTTKAIYKKRLKEHLRETKGHARELERRIKKLGGGGHAVQTVVAKTMAAAKGPMHMLRGSGEQEKMLKNAKTEYFNEQEEIATYLALEIFATKVGDRETAKLAFDIRRDEERMAKFLQGQIKQLAGAVAMEEVPRAQRTGSGGSRKRTASRRTSTAKRASPAKTSAKRKPAAKRKARTKAKSR